MAWIEKLDIAAFGGISGKSYSFTQGINLISAQNEKGKSTMLAAIRFALYGFTSTQHSITDNPKKKYMPWSGAAASVTLTVGGERRLRIERSVYGNKETALCTELSTGLPLYAGKVFGEEIFGIGADTADKTLFFTTLLPHQPKDEGLAESLQGLVFSADEQIGGDKAKKELTAYKNAIGGKNGIIPKLETRLKLLEEKHSEERSALTELDGLESEAERVKQALAGKERAVEKAEAERENLRRYKASLALAEYRAAEDRLEKARSAVSAFAHTGLSAEHIEHCNRLIEAKMQSEAKLGGLSARLGEAERSLTEDSEDLGEIAARCRSKRRLGVILGAVALLIIVAGAVLFIKGGIGAAAAPLVIGTAFGICALGMYLNSANTCKAYGCADIAELEAEQEAAEEKRRIAQKNCADLKAQLAAARAEYEEAKQAIKTAGAEDGTGQMVKDLLALNTLRGEETAAAAALAALKSRYSLSELEMLAKDFVKPAKNEEQIETEYKFATQGARMLREKLAPLSARIEALRLAKATLADTEEKLAWYSAELDMARLRHKAAVLAMEELGSAGDVMKASIAPRVAESASRYLSAATAGKYPALELDTRLYPSVESENGIKSGEYLSAGTRDVLYLTMRLAYIKLIYGEKATSLFLDDAFCRTDDTRLGAMLSLLAKGGNQLFITSCTDREQKTLDLLGISYKDIRL